MAEIPEMVKSMVPCSACHSTGLDPKKFERGDEARSIANIQGGITGYGFDYVIIDDPMKASLANSETGAPQVRRALFRRHCQSLAQSQNGHARLPRLS